MTPKAWNKQCGYSGSKWRETSRVQTKTGKTMKFCDYIDELRKQAERRRDRADNGHDSRPKKKVTPAPVYDVEGDDDQEDGDEEVGDDGDDGDDGGDGDDNDGIDDDE